MKVCVYLRQKHKTLSEKEIKSKRVGAMAEMVECKCKALSSIPSIAPKTTKALL
jgi:hypothetical protein